MPDTAQSSPAASASAKKIGDVLEFAGSKLEQTEPDKIRAVLKFRNPSPRRVTEIDYAFTFVDETDKVLLSIDLREGLFIPPGLTGESVLEWAKSGFKDPAAFETIQEAYNKGTLKAVVAIQQVKLDDGSVVEA